MSRLDRLTIQATTTAYSGTYKLRPNKEVPIKLGEGRACWLLIDIVIGVGKIQW